MFYVYLFLGVPHDLHFFFTGLVGVFSGSATFSHGFFCMALRRLVSTLPITCRSRHTLVMRVLAAESRWD